MRLAAHLSQALEGGRTERRNQRVWSATAAPLITLNNKLCVQALQHRLPNRLKEGLSFHFCGALKPSKGGEANSKTSQQREGGSTSTGRVLFPHGKAYNALQPGTPSSEFSSSSPVPPVLRKAVCDFEGPGSKGEGRKIDTY